MSIHVGQLLNSSDHLWSGLQVHPIIDTGDYRVTVTLCLSLWREKKRGLKIIPKQGTIVSDLI
jgi:hypothetical protein